ncbi:MAG: TetR-like C-terminal domain-containing protein [Jatrophihabitans sp.]
MYGTPIPGYAAPEETIPAAQRILVVVMDVLRDAVAVDALVIPADRLPKPVRTDMQSIAAVPDFAGIPPTVLARAVLAWTGIVGTISFELFGRYTNGLSDLDTYFEHQVKMMARYVGIS